MMIGRSPFQSQREEELFRRIKEDPVSFKLSKSQVVQKLSFDEYILYFQEISNEAQQIITALLKKVP